MSAATTSKPSSNHGSAEYHPARTHAGGGQFDDVDDIGGVRAEPAAAGDSARELAATWVEPAAASDSAAGRRGLAFGGGGDLNGDGAGDLDRVGDVGGARAEPAAAGDSARELEAMWVEPAAASDSAAGRRGLAKVKPQHCCGSSTTMSERLTCSGGPCQ